MTINQLTHDLRNNLGSAVALAELGRLLAQQQQFDANEIGNVFSDMLDELNQMTQRIEAYEQRNAANGAG